jgi:hypothetical protein
VVHEQKKVKDCLVILLNNVVQQLAIANIVTNVWLLQYCLAEGLFSPLSVNNGEKIRFVKQML